MKKNIKNIVIIILMIAVGFGVYRLIDSVANKYRWANQAENVVENTTDYSEPEKEVEKVNEDAEELPDNELVDNGTKSEIKKIEISDAEILDIFVDADLFESADELSTDDRLEIVYKALNRNKIVAYQSRVASQNTAEFTEGEINGIVYSLFGTPLKENKSYGDLLVYKNGKYTLTKSSSGLDGIVCNKIENDVAAGTMYINYELYVDGTLKGSYSIGKSNVSKLITCKKEM